MGLALAAGGARVAQLGGSLYYDVVGGLVTALSGVIWQHNDGTMRDNMRSHVPIAFPVGVPGLGGPIMTTGGLGLYSGSLHNDLRAYDLAGGREIWKARLPSGGRAPPMTYRSQSSGRQFVVAAAGGHSALATTDGDYLIAYARPRSK